MNREKSRSRAADPTVLLDGGRAVPDTAPTVRLESGSEQDVVGISPTSSGATVVTGHSLRSIAPPADPGLASVTAAAEAEDGSVVIGRFRLISELGRGGMGRVLEAWDPELGRRVALKVLTDGGDLSERDKARFLREAQVTSQLEHPNIVPIHDMGLTPSGHVFIVMKKVVGRSLTQMLRAVKDADVNPDEWGLHRRLAIFLNICNAVAYAHDRGVIHRDLKPANVMIGSFGEVLVMDWGLARVVDAPSDGGASASGGAGNGATVVGAVLGTPGYMSPEQLQGGSAPPDRRSDVWSLGALLFELLTGTRAFPSKDVTVLREAVKADLPDPRELNPTLGISEDLAAVCARAMAYSAADRFDSAQALAGAVEDILEGSRRREQADQALLEAAGYLDQAAGQRVEAEARRSEAAERMAGVAPNAPEADKAPGWALEDQALALESEAELNEVRFQEAARTALKLVDNHEGARTMLASYYRRRHEQAEAARDAGAAREFELLLRSYDLGDHAAYLAGTGRFSLHSDPPGAEVELFRQVEENRRLTARSEGVIGTTPINGRKLPIGAYTAVLRAPGRAEVRYVFTIERLKHWDGVGPGESEPRPVHLPAEGELESEDILVPAGWALTGGDPLAAGGLPRRRLWFESFVIRRHPVTHGEWLDYVNGLLADGEDEEAARRVPQEMGADGGPGAELYVRDVDGRYALPEAGPWRPDTPVAFIDWDSAMAYARHLAERDGRPWRLVDELEWEKAARGVDDRPFPWGWTHDPSRACTAESHAGPPQPAAVTDYPVDESPWGVRGLSGGIRDWCYNEFLPAGPPVDEDGRVRVSGPADGSGPRITRGGAWSLPDWVGRICCRGFHPPIRLQDLGMRLAYSPER